MTAVELSTASQNYAIIGDRVLEKFIFRSCSVFDPDIIARHPKLTAEMREHCVAYEFHAETLAHPTDASVPP
jgi:hypothetical protein